MTFPPSHTFWSSNSEHLAKSKLQTRLEESRVAPHHANELKTVALVKQDAISITGATSEEIKVQHNWLE